MVCCVPLASRHFSAPGAPHAHRILVVPPKMEVIKSISVDNGQNTLGLPF